jgi:DNA-binding protein Fis
MPRKLVTKHHIAFKEIIANHEFDLIEKAMNMAYENQSLAARILGISRSTLIKKIKQLRMRNG